MNGNTIKQCKFCGKLFQSMGANICPNCNEKLDEDFLKVREYIYDAPSDVSIEDVAKNTEVDEKTILYLLKEGRLVFGETSISGALRCEACGTAISKGRLCSTCSAAWGHAVGDVTKAKDTKKPEQAAKGLRMHTRD